MPSRLSRSVPLGNSPNTDVRDSASRGCPPCDVERGLEMRLLVTLRKSPRSINTRQHLPLSIIGRRSIRYTRAPSSAAGLVIPQFTNFKLEDNWQVEILMVLLQQTNVLG